jgi:hypothetical protein
MSKKTLAVVVNHNFNDAAINLKTILSSKFDTIIIDSGSDVQPDEFDIKLANVGYSGLFNRAAQEVIEKEYDWLLFVCSDVVMKKSDVDKLKVHIDELPGDIGVYSPASTGQSHKHCKNHSSGGLRDVVFVEGFIFAASRAILEKIYPVHTEINKLGHGLDAYKGYLCLKNDMRCVVDDRIVVFHREGTGYNAGEASMQFVNWMNMPPMFEFKEFWRHYLATGADSNETLRIFKKKLV